MKKMSKVVSHSVRLFKKSNDFNGYYDPCYDVIKEETYAEDGRVLKRSVIKTLNLAEEMAKYSPNDFRIENLVAVGAAKDKRYTYNPSTMDMMDSVGDAFDVLTDIVDNNNSNNTNE